MGQALSFVDTNDYPLPAGAGIATQQAAFAFLAPLLLGLVLNAFLIGCATPWLSAWLSASASGERSSTRWLVLISASFLYVNGGFSVVSIVLHGSNQRRSFDCISANPWFDLLGQIIGCTVAVLVQFFFARRSFLVLPPRWNWLFAIVVGLLAVTSYCANVVANAYVWRAAGIYDVQLIAIVLRFCLLWLAASALCDIAISSVLVGRLTMHRRSIVRNVGSGEFTSAVHERTFSWTRTLVQTSLATAGATTIVQTAALVLLAIDPYDWNGSGALMAILPGLYFLSMIGTLTLRDDFRSKLTSAAPSSGRCRCRTLSPMSARTPGAPWAASPVLREPIPDVLHLQLEKTDRESV